MNEIHPLKVTIVGLGLIGGSLGLALRRRGYRVTGIDPNPRARAAARRRGAAKEVYPLLSQRIASRSIVVLSVPMQAMERCLRELARKAGPRTVITDTGSTKESVMRSAGRLLPFPSRFVGGHPMAGSERSGMEAANPGLFRGRPVILTPRGNTQAGAVALVRRMWGACGARTVMMSPRRHDMMVARNSHLPHAVAIALLQVAGRRAGSLRLASSSLADATRVAASDPGLWRGIFEANRRQLAEAIGELEGSLRNIRMALRAGRGGSIEGMFRSARKIRGRLGAGQ